MISISDKNLCEACFSEISEDPCCECGFSSDSYIPDPTVLPCGSVLQGRYIVGRTIGKGGFGITYLAYDVKLERKVAIKEYYPYGLAVRNPGDPIVSVSDEKSADIFKKGAEKFYNEARLVARFNGNPAIVGVFDFFYENATVYYSMEYLKGQTLKSYISAYGALSDGQAVFVADNVSAALMTVHSANVLHRDISPDNIMLCDDGNVKLIDFGAARQVIADSSQNLSVILKPGFAPLEQYQKKGKQGPWTDIYSLGATLYYSLTGNIPEDPMSRLDDNGSIGPGAGDDNSGLWKVINKAVMLKIEDRYENVFDLRKDLSELPVAAEPIIEKTAVNEVPLPTGVTAQPYTAYINRTEHKTISSPRTEMNNTVKTDAADNNTAPVGTASAQPESASRKRNGLIYAAAGAAAVLAIGGASVALLSNGNQNEVRPETAQSESFTGTTAHDPEDDIIYDRKEDLYPFDNDEKYEFEESGSNTPITEPEVTEPTETEPEVTEPTVTEPEVTEPTVTEPPVTEPPVTKPEVTEPTVTKPAESAPAVPDTITIDGKSYKTNMTGVLNLSGKGLENKDIAGLKYMTNLNEIILSDNYLTDLSALSNLTQLEKLTYHNNDVKSLAYAKKLKKLKVLGAENNGISDLSPLSGMTELTEIWLMNNNISDMSPLKKCKNVNSLSLSGNPIKDCSAASGMKKIRNLHLFNCGIKSLEPFKGCTKLEYVYIGNNQISDLTPLCGNKGLMDLDAHNNNLNGNYDAIRGLTILNYFDISENNFYDPDELFEFMCNDIFSDDDGLAYRA